MQEEKFLRTMIDTVKYDDAIKNKEKLITLLMRSQITYNKLRSWTGKISYQREEKIDLRVPVPMLTEARGYQKQLESIAASIYIQTEEYDFAGLEIKPKEVERDTENVTEHDVVFDEIKNKIIQGIRGANYLIWIAVAWLTDDELIDELIARKKDGINIRIITSDESSNWNIPKLENNFEVVKAAQIGKNRMHDKFCIIDLEYVMHGSYNWSKAARSNDETLATALDREFVRKFADEFMTLYLENK